MPPKTKRKMEGNKKKQSMKMFGNLTSEWWILELQTTTMRDLEKMFRYNVLRRMLSEYHSQNHGLADAHSNVLKEHRLDMVVFFKGQTKKPELTDGKK